MRSVSVQPSRARGDPASFQSCLQESEKKRKHGGGMGSHGLFFSSLSHSFVCVAFGDPKAPFRASRRYICCSFSGKRSFLLFCNHALFLFPSVKPLRMRNQEGEPVERSQHPVFSSVSLKTRCIYLSRQTRTASRLFGTLSVSWDAGDTTLKKKKKNCP